MVIVLQECGVNCGYCVLPSVCLICNEDGVPYLMSPNMCFSQQYLALAVVKEQLSVEVLK